MGDVNLNNKKITSLKSYVDAIMDLRTQFLDEGLQSYQMFFRGQKDCTWSVEPSAYRNDGVNKETDAINGALRQNPFEFSSCNTYFEKLTKLQHYGLGTRLLDVTLNPLVALYFATDKSVQYKENKNGQYTQTANDGCVFIEFSNWYSTDSLAIRIASAIPFLDIDEVNTFEKLLEHLKTHYIISSDESVSLSKDNYKLLIEYIQKDYFVISSHSNERLIRQSGAFVLPTNINIDYDFSYPQNSKISKSRQVLNSHFNIVLTIPDQAKDRIREELDFFNINEATMFPELEHQMTYIKGKHIPVLGSVPSFKRYDVGIPIDLIDETYNDLEPNVDKIIEKMFPDISGDIKKVLINEIKKYVKLIDWKQKDTVKSSIKINVKRIIQSSYSATESSNLADELLKMLVNPSEEFAMEKQGD